MIIPIPITKGIFPLLMFFPNHFPNFLNQRGGNSAIIIMFMINNEVKLGLGQLLRNIHFINCKHQYIKCK